MRFIRLWSELCCYFSLISLGLGFRWIFCLYLHLKKLLSVSSSWDEITDTNFFRIPISTRLTFIDIHNIYSFGALVARSTDYVTGHSACVILMTIIYKAIPILLTFALTKGWHRGMWSRTRFLWAFFSWSYSW